MCTTSGCGRKRRAAHRALRVVRHLFNNKEAQNDDTLSSGEETWDLSNPIGAAADDLSAEISTSDASEADVTQE